MHRHRETADGRTVYGYLQNSCSKEEPTEMPKRKNLHKYRYMYLLAIPGVIYFAVFKIAPLWGLSLAFVDYNSFKGLLGSEFVGFANFLKFSTTTISGL